MGTLSQTSKKRIKTWDIRPNHKLYVDGEELSEDLVTASVTFTSDGGGSGAQLTIMGDLMDYENAPIELWLGYGDDLVPYFVGRIQRPRYIQRIDRTETMAFGPFKLMSDQILEEEVSYQGLTLNYALGDLIDKAGYLGGETEVVGGENIVITTDEVFPYFNTLSDTANTLMEQAGYIGVDQPGGTRVFRRKPRPGVQGAAVEHYSASEYGKDALDIQPTTEFGYSKVIVVQTSVTGAELGRYEALVKRQSDFPPPARRVFVVDGFVGSELDAAQEAQDLAAYLRAGDLNFTFTVPLNPELELYDVIEVERIHRGERYVYSCVINGDIQIEYTPATRTTPGVASMGLSGNAVEVVRAQAAGSVVKTRTPTGSVVRL